MLQLQDIRKFFGSHLAVGGITLQIRDGEFFSLLGPSGCGKTTLLRLLAGFEAPDSGEIHHQGRRVDTLPAHERQFNLVFQRYALFPHLNVFENVAFGPRMKKLPSVELRKRVEAALALVKMGTFGRRSVSTLSGGQQQRVALARALVNRPSVLLLDEPLSALDLKLREEMRGELRALQRRVNHSFIFVTHDQDEALGLSDRIAVMNDGRIEQVGTPQEIYERPATVFVAKFIGSMNDLPEGGMIRPEKLTLSNSSVLSPEQASLSCVLRETRFLGPVIQHRVEIAGGSFRILSIHRPAGEELPARPGQELYVVWNRSDVVIPKTLGPETLGPGDLGRA